MAFQFPTNEVEIKDYVTNQAMMAGKIGDDQVAQFIEEQAAMCPTASAAEAGANDDLRKAYMTLKIAEGADMSGAPAPKTPVTRGKGGKAAPVSTLTAAQSAALEQHVLDTMKSRADATANCKVRNFFIARPVSADYIPEGTMGTIKVDSWKNIADKIASGEYVVCEDSQKGDKTILSKTNYEKLAQSAKNGSADVLVARTDKPGAAIGYEINVAMAPNAPENLQIYSKQAAKSFLELKTSGYLTADPDNLGLTLRSATRNSKDASKQSYEVTVLADTNKKAAVEGKHFKSVRRVTATKVEKTLKSELSFYVNKRNVVDGKIGDLIVNDKGEARRWAIRASVVATVFELEIIPEYEGTLPTGTYDPTKAITDPDKLRAITQATVRDLAVTLSDKGSAFAIDERLRDDLNALRQAIAPAGGAAENVGA